MAIDTTKNPGNVMAVLNPSMGAWWLAGMGEKPAVLVQIEHPQHGILSFVWPNDEAIKVRDAMTRAIDKVLTE